MFIREHRAQPAQILRGRGPRETVVGAGLAEVVARLVPLAVLKG